MARTPFKLRSGNTTPFKQMGSSPVKAVVPTSSLEPIQEDEPRGTVSYKQAYSSDTEGRSEAEFTKAAKKWNMDTYGTHNPTADAKKQGITKKELAAKWKASQTQSAESTGETVEEQRARLNRNQEAEKLIEAQKRTDEGLKSGRLKKAKLKSWKGAEHLSDVEVVRPTVKSKRVIGVEEAKGRGKERVKAARKIFGRGSAEVKAAKKARKASVKKAKGAAKGKGKKDNGKKDNGKKDNGATESTTYTPKSTTYKPKFVKGGDYTSQEELRSMGFKV